MQNQSKKFKDGWNNKTKRNKITFIVKTSLWIIAAVFLLLALFSKQLFGEESIFGSILGDSVGGFMGLWDAIVAKLPTILKSIVIIIVVLAIARFIRYIVKKALTRGKRGETIAKMLDSFIKYAIAIVMAMLLLAAWGVDTVTLIAGAGILGLVIGLGAQSLIADVIAGLFIVFEGDFQIGDIVVIDDWRGTVKEIGIRTTKVIDAGGNLKIVNNSTISTVINMTSELSLAICDVGVEYGESIERVETVIRDNLDKIRARIPAIVDGPFYKGIDRLGDSSVVVKIIANCKEEDKFQTQRDLNREIKVVFDNNNINIPFQQVVLNQPPVFEKKIGKKTIAAAQSFVDEQKELSKGLEDKN